MSPEAADEDPSRPPPTTPFGVLDTRWVGFILALNLLLLALVTSLLASGNGLLHHADRAVASWGYNLTYGHHHLSNWWIAVAKYGQPMVLRVALVALALVLLVKGRRALAAWLFGVAVAENVIAPLAKYLLNRPRPHWLHPIAVEHSLSYPSGHATAAGMFISCVVLVVLVTRRATAPRMVAIALALAIGLTVSLDRIFLGVHYLSDVVGGNLLGAAIAFTGWILMLRVVRTNGVEGSLDPGMNAQDS